MEVLHYNESRSSYRVVDAATALFVTLDGGVSKGAIDKGRRGETVGRMILLRAYMHAVKETCSSEGRKLTWSTGCGLVTFLKCLTAAGFHQTFMGCKPDNIVDPQSRTLEDAFRKAWVRFTHFVRAGDGTAVSTLAAWPPFVRSMTFIFCDSEESVDVCIPVLLDKEAPIEEKNMAVIVVQFRRRTHARAAAAYTINGQAIGIFLSEAEPSNWAERTMNAYAEEMGKKREKDKDKIRYNPRPYISLVMEFPGQRGHPKVLDQVDAQTFKHQKLGPTPKLAPTRAVTIGRADRKSSSLRTPTDKHPRYSLTFYGCSSDVYGCISKQSNAHYKMLLQLSGNEFADHPRPHTLSKVLQMKPFWEIGKESYG